MAKSSGYNNKGLTRQQGVKFISFAGLNELMTVETGYGYASGIVVDVISDPKTYFNNKLDKQKFYSEIGNDYHGQIDTEAQDLGENLSYKVPKNSIICKLIDDGEAQYSNNKVLCYPFFSPHFALPVKPGEHVWLMVEKFYGITRFYWMNRKHGSYYNDNVNLTSHEREVSIYAESPLKEGIFSFSNNQILKMHNFPDVSTAKSSNLISPDQAFNNSNAYRKEFTNEPVPEIIKKCGDLVLQGSNNTLIQLTTEKFTNSDAVNERYSKDLFLPEGKQTPADVHRIPQSPAIDIAVARKKNHFKKLTTQQGKIRTATIGEGEKNKLSIVENNRSGIDGIENYELNKFNENPESNLDKDPSNCGARIYMSNNCNIDEIFNISDTQDSQKIFPRYGGATLTGYSEHIRFIAEGDSSSFRIVKKYDVGENNTGQTFFEIDNAGKVKIGSKEGKVNSGNDENFTAGNSGMQPFVRGDDLEDILALIIDQINEIAISLQTNGVAGVNITPGQGLPNPGLEAIGKNMSGIIANLGDIQVSLPKFKSSLIKGE